MADRAGAGLAPYCLAALRIMTALLFIEHATIKLLHFPAAMPGLDGPLPPFLLASAWIEAATGTLVLLGLWTRIAAFLASGEMAVGYFALHAPAGFWPALNKGEAAVLFCFIFLHLAAAGPGAFALDTRRARG